MQRSDDQRNGTAQPSDSDRSGTALPFSEPLPRFKKWCRICERVGAKRWPSMGLLDALISPHGTAHFQKEDRFETTVCGLDATRGNWRWPE